MTPTVWRFAVTGRQDATLNYQLGNLCRPGLSHGLTCRAGWPRVSVRDPLLPGLMAR